MRLQSQVLIQRPSAQTTAIFDPESLLLDPAPGIEYALRAAMHDLSIEIPEGWFTAHWSPRTPFWKALNEVTGTNDPDVLGLARDLYFSHFNETGRFRCTLRPEGMPLLVRLANNPGMELHYLTHIGARAAARLLDTYGLQHFPRSIVTAETPACPGIRLSLLKQLIESGRRREDWVLLSDHPWELMAARCLGIRAIGIAYGRLSPESLGDLQAQDIASTPLDVAHLLQWPGAPAAGANRLH
jgi:phosphoglycolate phosphatase-like HAD superfamily hydrolase